MVTQITFRYVINDHLIRIHREQLYSNDLQGYLLYILTLIITFSSSNDQKENCLYSKRFNHPFFMQIKYHCAVKRNNPKFQISNIWNVQLNIKTIPKNSFVSHNLPEDDVVLINLWGNVQTATLSDNLNYLIYNFPLTYRSNLSLFSLVL